MLKGGLLLGLCVPIFACAQSARDSARARRHADDWEIVNHSVRVDSVPQVVALTRHAAIGRGGWLCLSMPKGFGPGHLPLAVVDQEGDTLRVGASLVLEDGTPIPMRFVGVQAWRAPDGGHGQNYCLVPTASVPAGDGAHPRSREMGTVRIWSNRRVVIERMYWEPSRP